MKWISNKKFNETSFEDTVGFLEFYNEAIEDLIKNKRSWQNFHSKNLALVATLILLSAILLLTLMWGTFAKLEEKIKKKVEELNKKVSEIKKESLQKIKDVLDDSHNLKVEDVDVDVTIKKLS